MGKSVRQSYQFGLMMLVLKWLLIGINTCWKWILIGWGNWCFLIVVLLMVVYRGLTSLFKSNNWGGGGGWSDIIMNP
jgi:hypothetical protein